MINTSNGLAGIVRSIVDIFNMLLPVLTALALVYFMIGVVKYIRHEGEHENRDAIMWSLVVLFVLLSFWGILGFMTRTFLGATGSNSGYSGGSAGGNLPPIN